MMNKLTAACAVIIALAIAGCSKNTENAVIVKVNNSKITAADIKKQLDELQPQMLRSVATDSKARKEFVEDLIGIELVLQEAKRQGLDKDPEFKKRQEALRREMEQRIQESAKNELFNAMLKKELMDKIKPPTDDEVKTFYDTHRDDIRKAAGGKDLTLKQAEAQGLKRYVFQMKQREAYLDYSKGLKAKAKIVVDEKALDTLASELSRPSTTGPAGTLQLAPPAAPAEKKGEATRK